jgi:hypothetical protein
VGGVIQHRFAGPKEIIRLSQLQSLRVESSSRLSRGSGWLREPRRVPSSIADPGRKGMASVRSPKYDLRWPTRSLEALALITFVSLFYFVPDGATPLVLIANLVTFYTLFLRAIAVHDRILPWLPSYFSVEVLFFVFSYLIFYYPYQLFVVGATDLGVSRYVSNSFVDGSNKAITLTTVGMLAFTIGYRALGEATRDVGADSGPSKMGHNNHQGAQSHYFHAMATASGLLLLALVALYLLAGWRSAGEGRYTGTTTNSLGTEGLFLAILMLCMIVAALWVHAKAAEFRTPPMLAVGLVVAIAWTGRLLLLGDRSSLLLFGLVLVGGYFTFVRRSSLLILAIVLGIWMFLYNIIEALRSIPNWYNTGNFWTLLENSRYYQDSSRESSFNITTMTVRAAVQAVPDTHDFMYGVFKLIQFSSAIPFSGKLYLPYLNPEHTSSAEMLGDIMIGGHASWNPGTNVISDSYIDFGVPGVVVILFAIGLFANAIRNYVARDPYDAHRLVMYLLTMASFAELPRYAIDLPVRLLVWAFILSILIGAMTERLRSRDPAPPIAGKIPERPSLAGRQRS